MKFIDLHTHSDYSDGTLTPKELVRYAKERGLSAIALADHDCITGVKEAILEGEKIGIEVVPAIEFAASSETEVHILGFYIDIENKQLNDALSHITCVRAQRIAENCKKLQEIGVNVSIEEVKEISGNGILCRAHIAQILVNKGYCQTVREAFKIYLGANALAHSDKQALSDKEVIKLINDAGGMAFLAHPHLTKKPYKELIEYIKELKSFGLCGIEGYYTDYTDEMQCKYQNIAEEYGLLISGGTDFHGKTKPDIEIGIGHGNMQIPYSVLESIKAAHG